MAKNNSVFLFCVIPLGIYDGSNFKVNETELNSWARILVQVTIIILRYRHLYENTGPGC